MRQMLIGVLAAATWGDSATDVWAARCPALRRRLAVRDGGRRARRLGRDRRDRTSRAAGESTAAARSLRTRRRHPGHSARVHGGGRLLNGGARPGPGDEVPEFSRVSLIDRSGAFLTELFVEESVADICRALPDCVIPEDR